MGLWLKRLSFVALLGFPLSVLGTRLGLFDFRVGFTGVTWTVYLSVLVFVVALVLMLLHRNSKPTSANASRTAILISLIPLLGIGSQLFTARSVPAIHNISTDTQNPPEFSAAVVGLRGDNSNPLAYDQVKLARAQKKAYPQVKTLHSSLSRAQAHQRSVVLVQQLGWELVNESLEQGVVEATETTALWAFKDDVVIRILADESGSVIDLRSVSRVGGSDLGANAKRIERFLEAFAEN